MVLEPKARILGKLGRNFTKKKEGRGGVLLKHISKGRVGCHAPIGVIASRRQAKPSSPVAGKESA